MGERKDNAMNSRYYHQLNLPYSTPHQLNNFVEPSCVCERRDLPENTSLTLVGIYLMSQQLFNREVYIIHFQFYILFSLTILFFICHYLKILFDTTLFIELTYNPTFHLGNTSFQNPIRTKLLQSFHNHRSYDVSLQYW